MGYELFGQRKSPSRWEISYHFVFSLDIPIVCLQIPIDKDNCLYKMEL